MGFTPVKRPKGRPRNEPIAVLDVGTSKVVCFIARFDETDEPQIIGIGHQVSHGVRAGTVVDMEAAAQAIGHAVEAAEQMADVHIESVTLNLSGGHPVSQTVGVEVGIAGHEVGDADLRKAMRGHHTAAAMPPDSQIVHAIPVGYAIDGARGIRDPRGMFGEKLEIDLHLITAGSGAIRNLATCVERCHLTIDGFVVSAYAAGLAALVEDEMALGATLIDMGAGATSIGVFFEGALIFTDTIPVGGGHVTNDIARGLTTPVAHAERIKTLYGAAIPSVADEREIIHVPQIGEDDESQASQAPKSLLTGIIQPRIEEIFELVRGRIEASGFSKVSGRRVVLTGGASQLQGARELAQLVLDKQVRMGRPAAIGGLAEATSGPAFATAAGLIVHARRNPAEIAAMADVSEPRMPTPLRRLGGWLRDNF